MISLFLLAGIFSTYVLARRENSILFNEIELHANANLALKLIVNDLSKTGFFGTMTGAYLRDQDNAIVSPALKKINDCYDERHPLGGSFPDVGLNGVLRPLFVTHVGQPKEISTRLSCINKKKVRFASDIISIKRVFGSDLSGSHSSLKKNRIYMGIKSHQAHFYSYNDLLALHQENNHKFDSLFEYQHHLYFVSDTGDIPELKLAQLTDEIDISHSLSLVQGVEYLHILLGVDDSIPSDGIADRYVPAESISDTEWNLFSFTDAKIFILVRALNLSPDFNNDDEYQLGDIKLPPFHDHYRRLLVQDRVTFLNRISY